MYRLETILINTDEDECFFHVLGDTTKYFDLESMTTAHPELSTLVQLNYRELERELFRQRGLLGLAESY